HRHWRSGGFHIATTAIRAAWSAIRGLDGGVSRSLGSGDEHSSPASFVQTFFIWANSGRRLPIRIARRMCEILARALAERNHLTRGSWRAPLRWIAIRTARV